MFFSSLFSHQNTNQNLEHRKKQRKLPDPFTLAIVNQLSANRMLNWQQEIMKTKKKTAHTKEPRIPNQRLTERARKIKTNDIQKTKQKK